jgi:hypothetical protein
MTIVSILFIQPAWAEARVEDQKDDETFKTAARAIVLANAVQTPAAGQPFISLLNNKVAEHSKLVSETSRSAHGENRACVTIHYTDFQVA